MIDALSACARLALPHQRSAARQGGSWSWGKGSPGAQAAAAALLSPEGRPPVFEGRRRYSGWGVSLKPSSAPSQIPQASWTGRESRRSPRRAAYGRRCCSATCRRSAQDEKGVRGSAAVGCCAPPSAKRAPLPDPSSTSQPSPARLLARLLDHHDEPPSLPRHAPPPARPSPRPPALRGRRLGRPLRQRLAGLPVVPRRRRRRRRRPSTSDDDDDEGRAAEVEWVRRHPVRAARQGARGSGSRQEGQGRALLRRERPAVLGPSSLSLPSCAEPRR